MKNSISVEKLKYREDLKDLRHFTSTLCELMNVSKPELSVSDSFEQISAASKNTKTKALIYAPDAFGVHALEHYPRFHEQLKKLSTHEVPLKAMVPPVTPVCFASLFTGATPKQHGIESYRKPVLTCDTVFDALARAEKKVAIIAVTDCSVDTIFKGRTHIDYFSMYCDSMVTVKAIELLEKNEHDVIVVYHQEYDDLLHDTGPFSEVGEWALERHVKTYDLLIRKVKQIWKKDYVIAFTPDHGAHVHPATGLGDHGEERDEDMLLQHFYVLD